MDTWPRQTFCGCAHPHQGYKKQIQLGFIFTFLFVLWPSKKTPNKTPPTPSAIAEERVPKKKIVLLLPFE
jgi:hypothetical protein